MHEVFVLTCQKSSENQGKRGVEILGNKQVKDCLGECSPMFKSEVVYCEVVSSKQLFTIACYTSSTRFSERKIKIWSLLFACQGLFHTSPASLRPVLGAFALRRSSLFLSWSGINPIQAQNKGKDSFLHFPFPLKCWESGGREKCYKLRDVKSRL